MNVIGDEFVVTPKAKWSRTGSESSREAFEVCSLVRWGRTHQCKAVLRAENVGSGSSVRANCGKPFARVPPGDRLPGPQGDGMDSSRVSRHHHGRRQRIGAVSDHPPISA